MVCIYCGFETRVTNSRHQKRLNRVWRRRQCYNCSSIFTTLEAIDLGGSIVVRRKTSLEPFNRDKLLFSIYGSLKHRKTALQDASGLTDTIISRLLPGVTDALVESVHIVEMSAVVLEHFDKVAAVHYRAFHP